MALTAGPGYGQAQQPAGRPQTKMSQPVPGGGVSVIAAEGASALRLSAKPDDARLEQVEVHGPDGSPTKALRIQTLRKPQHHWEIQAQTTSIVAVKKGDVLLAAFAVRCLEPKEGPARTSFVFELNRDPWQKSVEFLVSAGADWQRVFVPFQVERDYAIGQANIAFHLGMGIQTMEIGEFSLRDLGQEARLADMPGFAYEGHEEDAPWRQAAAQRIEKIRKADLTVSVLTATSQPAANADVRVRMTRHAFPFGSAIAIDGVKDPGPDGQKYRQFIERNFNRIVFENDLKWRVWKADNVWARKFRTETLAWLDQNSIQARGHCLVWPSWRNLPQDLAGLKDDPAALGQRVTDHIAEEVGALRGRLVEWDVINEPYDNHDLMDILGNEAMVDWFKQARAADPGARLFINDYAILANGGRDAAHQDHYEKTIRFLIDRQAPLAGIGIQGHFRSQLTGPQQMLSILDRFAALGKDIEITEFDADIPDERMQADFTRDFYTAMFSHQAVTGVLMWGFWEGRHWRPPAAMVRKDWTLKPNGQAWMDLIHKEWTTDVSGKTDAQGRFATRGFLGDYEVSVCANGKTQSARMTLSKSAGQMQIVLGR